MSRIKLVQTISQERGGPSEHPRRVIEWPDGLSLPHEGDFITLAEDDEFTVRQVDYTPLRETVATITAEPATARGDQTAAEYAALHRPGWTLR